MANLQLYLLSMHNLKAELKAIKNRLGANAFEQALLFFQGVYGNCDEERLRVLFQQA